MAEFTESRESQLNISFSLQEVLYVLFLLSTMGAKAIGLTEGQIPFTVALILGSLAIFLKIIISEYSVLEFCVHMTLIALGIVVYVNTHHCEAFFAVLMIVGMKDMSLNRACKTASFIWIACFLITILRSLFGILPGYIGVQQKLGMDSAVIRYSLGYTHPNVLHMTYLVIVMLLLYSLKLDGKRLLMTSVGLMLGNAFVFLYSLSYTGVICVSIYLLLNLYLRFRKRISMFEMLLAVLSQVGAILFMIVFPYVLSGNIRELLNKLLNYRFDMVTSMFGNNPARLFGTLSPVLNGGHTLDCSYAYMIMFHGIIAFALFVMAFVGELVVLLKKDDREGAALIWTLSVSGIAEQYIANLSFKNIGYFFIGDFVNRTVLSRISKKDPQKKFSLLKTSKEFSMKSLNSLIAEIRIFKEKICFKMIFFLSFGVAILSMIVTLFVFETPKHFYSVVGSREPESGILREYHREDELFENVIIVGNPTENCVVEEIRWADLGLEKPRALVGAFIMGFVWGFIVLAIVSFVFRKNDRWNFFLAAIEAPFGIAKRRLSIINLRGHERISSEEFNNWLADRIEKNIPTAVVRFGGTEMKSFRKYEYNMIHHKNLSLRNEVEKLCALSGYFPNDVSRIDEFCKLNIDLLPYADAIGNWDLPFEHYFVDKYMKEPIQTELDWLEPYNCDEPWSKALEGKRVLVIHPFTDSIKKQYEMNREQLFENKNILPSFTLYTIKAVQSLGGVSDADFADWFEALDYMYDEARKVEFDVAIIGCGAYGMPLALRLKRDGKIAIHLGGATQMLFGIYGKRWEESRTDLINRYWIRPGDEERSSNFNQVEGGCYW